MMFGTASLAARIEEAECALVGDMTEAVGRRYGTDTVVVTPVSGGVAVFAGSAMPMNKIAGLGFQPLDEVALAAIEVEFDRRHSPLQVELASLALHTEVGTALCRRGYALMGFENVLALALPLADDANPNGAIDVHRATPDESTAWLDVIASGFSHPDQFDGPASHEEVNREALEQVFATIGEISGFERYLARRNGVVMASAAMRVRRGIAQMCGAATLTEHRGQGAQTALLQSRLREAGRDGCDLAIVTTQPGSKSQANMQRQGFSLLYTRALLVRPPSA